VKHYKIILLVFFSVALPTIIFSREFQTVTINKLSEILNINNLNNYILIDARGELYYEKEHIFKAISIPKKQIKNKLLISSVNKAVSLIFYCSNILCSDSKEAAEIAYTLGYRNIFILKDGIKGWKEAGNKIEKGILAETEKYKIAAVTPGDISKKAGEYSIFGLIDLVKISGKIPDSKIIQSDNFINLSNTIPKDRKIVIYAISEELQNLAAYFLCVKGWQADKIFTLEGGFENWKVCKKKIVYK